MGTRNMTFVVEGGEYRVAQYGQWDGYPSGQGVNIVEFMREQENRNRLRRGLARVRFLNFEDAADKKMIDDFNAAMPGQKFTDGEVVTTEDKRTPYQLAWFEQFMTRDLCGDILKSVASLSDDRVMHGPENQAAVVPIHGMPEFAADSLFCEWAYVIDFDKNLLEVYRGFNSTIPLTELDRFYFLQQPDGQQNSDGYYPIIKIIEFSLDSLPTNKDFCDMCEKAAERKFPEEAKGEESEPVTEEGL